MKVTQADVHPVLARFKELDADHSGFLDRDDLVSGVGSGVLRESSRLGGWYCCCVTQCHTLPQKRLKEQNPQNPRQLTAFKETHTKSTESKATNSQHPKQLTEPTPKTTHKHTNSFGHYYSRKSSIPRLWMKDTQS
jgi:hypothetical protein